MNYLKYISDKKIDSFIKSVCCPHAKTIIVADSEERNYINVFTNLLDKTLHITNFECINLDTHKDYSALWRRFVIFELDNIKEKIDGQYVGDKYIDEMHDRLEANTIVGPTI